MKSNIKELCSLGLLFGLCGAATAQNSGVIVSGGGQPSPANQNVIISGGAPGSAAGTASSTILVTNTNRFDAVGGLGNGGTAVGVGITNGVPGIGAATSSSLMLTNTNRVGSVRGLGANGPVGGSVNSATVPGSRTIIGGPGTTIGPVPGVNGPPAGTGVNPSVGPGGLGSGGGVGTPTPSTATGTGTAPAGTR